MKITRTIPMMDVVVKVYDKETESLERQDYSLIDGTDVEKFINQFEEVKYIDHRVVGQYENKLIITLDERAMIDDYSFRTITPDEKNTESEVEENV